VLRRLYTYWFKKTGWTVEGQFEPLPDKFIVVIGPHTANMDFIIGIIARSVLRLTATKYLGKRELFRFPYGFLFRALGGYPVERRQHKNQVEAVVEIFNRHEKFSIALAPEGTRAKVKRLRTGFYHIAKRLTIPIYPVGFDYAQKKIMVHPPFYPTDDREKDFRQLITFFAGIRGKYPEKGIDISILAETIKAEN